jgi:ABC-2 type transport system ATP-binding protein
MDEKKLICDYSNGNKQLIGIIAACLPYSDFVLLDEPFNYLDETTVNELVKMLDFLNQEKSISIVYSDNLKRINLSNYESLSIENGNLKA